MKRQNLTLFKVDISTNLLLPYADGGIRAGFPSPAQDYIELSIDLNKELIKNPSSTFLGRVSGDSMIDEDITDGDVIIIDKSLDAKNKDLVVCFIDGEFTLKRMHIEKDVIWLVPSNPNYPKIKVTKDNDFIVWGVVTYTIKNNRQKR